ncbi:hypothetical protein K439DRAFT_1302877, partial [Ramaria rubella]
QLLGVILDNASNNDTMVNHLQTLIPTFRGQKTHVHCFTHIINLICQAILSVF